jgi:ribosomal protein S18 acetylase RimI-like enzyme
VPRFSSRPIAERDLADIEPWFDDEETRRWLGGRDWPHRLLGLATNPRRHALVWQRDGEPVALVDLECCADASAAVAIVVRPDARRQGIGGLVMRSLVELPETAGLDLILAEVEHGNEAAERLVRTAGFAPHRRGAEGGFSRWRFERSD